MRIEVSIAVEDSKTQKVEHTDNIFRINFVVNAKRTQMLSEADMNEIQQAYQRAIKDKDILETENITLKEELNRFSRLSLPHTHSRSISNVSNVSTNNDEDFGYASAKNTLELKKSRSPPSEENESPSKQCNLMFVFIV